MKDLARLRNREDVLATTVLQKAPVIKEQSFCCLPVFETEMDLSNKANNNRVSDASLQIASGGVSTEEGWHQN